MTKDIWINLPVGDIEKSKEFFRKIGFRLNEKYTSAEMACFEVGEKNVSVVFIAAETLRGFAKSEITDARAGIEVLISLGAASRAEIDESARRVFDAGGTIVSEPQEIEGWMYGFVFADLDGHRWNAIYMDFSKMPPQQ